MGTQSIRPLLLLLGLCLASAALLGACGDGEDTSSAGTAAKATDSAPGEDAGTTEETGGDTGDSGSTEENASLSKAQFIRRADAICAKTDEKKLEGLEKAAQENTDGEETRADQEALIVDVVLPEIQREAEELAALGAPAGDEQMIEEMVSALEEAVSKIEADPSIVFAETGGPFDKANGIAAKYGLNECDLAQ